MRRRTKSDQYLSCPQQEMHTSFVPAFFTQFIPCYHILEIFKFTLNPLTKCTLSKHVTYVYFRKWLMACNIRVLLPEFLFSTQIGVSHGFNFPNWCATFKLKKALLFYSSEILSIDKQERVWVVSKGKGNQHSTRSLSFVLHWICDKVHFFRCRRPGIVPPWDYLKCWGNN